MDKASQKEKILAYCEEHGSITVRDAVVNLGINSPTKRISELRHGGYDVKVVEEIRTKDNGEKVRYNRYFIKAVADNG